MLKGPPFKTSIYIGSEVLQRSPAYLHTQGSLSTGSVPKRVISPQGLRGSRWWRAAQAAAVVTTAGVLGVLSVNEGDSS